MKSLITQFFASHTELLELARSRKEKFGFHVVEKSFKTIFMSSSPALGDIRVAMPELSFILSFEYRPNVDCPNLNQFQLVNPNGISLSMGKQTNSALTESYVGCRSDDETVIKNCRSMQSDVRKLTKAGMWWVLTDGSRIFSKKDRYTEGVKQLVGNGIRVRQLITNEDSLEPGEVDE